MKNHFFAILATLVLGLGGCSSQPTTETQPATTETSKKDIIVATPAPESDQDIQVKDLKARWADIQTLKKEGDYGWMEEAKGYNKAGIDACNAQISFGKFSQLNKTAKDHPDALKEANIGTIEEIHSMYAGWIEKYLKAFTDVAGKNIAVVCKSGREGNQDSLFNASDLEDVLTEMKMNGITPEEVGVTPAKIRATHLALIKRDLPELKRRIDADNNADAIGAIGWMMREWQYTAADFGLTPAQMAKINPPGLTTRDGEGH